jgi:predicted ATP-grasp superfamily ATP-dependent carboligase
MAGSSKFAAGRFSYPSPYVNPEGFVEAVSAAARKFGASVYIPVHEEVLVAARLKDRFPKDLIIPVAPYEILMTAYDKELTMRAATAAGVSIPQTLFVPSLDVLPSLAEEALYPVMVKLRKSNSAKGVFRFDSKEDLLFRYPRIVHDMKLRNDSLPIIQQYIPGKVYAVSMLFDCGTMVSKFVRRNIREKTYGGGTCTKCVSVTNPVLEDEARLMLESLSWHGPAMMEFKYDEAGGKSYLLEINPRYHGTIDHDIMSGVPTPWYQYLLATGRAAEIPAGMSYRLGYTSRWFIGDIIGIIDNFRNMRSAAERFRYLREVLTFDEDSSMDFKADDPMPFFAEAWFYLEKFIRTGSRNPIDEGMLG